MAHWAGGRSALTWPSREDATKMHSQSGAAAMLPYSKLEYGGFRNTVSAPLKRFRRREERKPEAAE